MTRFLVALACAFGLVATPALASKVTDAPGEMIVRDEAGLFSTEAVAKAKQAFHDTTFHGHVKLAVHTVKAIPDSKKSEFAAVDTKDKNSLGRFFSAWAKELAAGDGKPNVVVLLYYDGHKYYPKVIADEAADLHRSFSNSKCNKVSEAFNAAMKTAFDKKLTGDALHTVMDPMLLAQTKYVESEMKNTSLPHANSTVSTHAADSGKGSIMSYLCIGLCVLAGAWLVIGLIRAFTGGGGGGGMGGGGFGGGGGGFMSGLMGGLFGSMAGMWMYNNFFGGGMGSLGASESMTGGDAGSYDTGEGNYDTGAASDDNVGGGDWGDSGGDVGGGGDWGGGGDFGGGDFGGGDW